MGVRFGLWIGRDDMYEVAGTMFEFEGDAADAWAVRALPDPSVIGPREDMIFAAERLVAFWAGEAAKIGEDLELPREICEAALVRRIRRARWGY
jgi:hypothetical protein